MLIPDILLVLPAASGLAGIPFGGAIAPALGLAGLALAAAFVGLLGGLAPAGTAAEEADAADPLRRIQALDRRVQLFCAAKFGALALLCAGLAWEVWARIGAGPALGLVAGGVAFGAAGLAFGLPALRRRGSRRG